MKTILILFISIILLSSCGSNLPMDNQITKPYRVVKISEQGYSKSLCQYDLETGQDHINFIDNICIVDSIGKFAIGDSINLSANKRK